MPAIIAIDTGPVLLPLIADPIGMPVLTGGLHGAGAELAVGMAVLLGMGVLAFTISSAFTSVVIRALDFLSIRTFCFSGIGFVIIWGFLNSFFGLVLDKFKSNILILKQSPH